jgi:hypothetical protein
MVRIAASMDWLLTAQGRHPLRVAVLAGGDANAEA